MALARRRVLLSIITSPSTVVRVRERDGMPCRIVAVGEKSLTN